MPLISSPPQRGFSLIEVLIALLVLAIGLLGMASLMLTSMQTSQSAGQRSQATVMAYDIIERMRANRDQAAIDDSPYEASIEEAEAPECDSTAGCTPAQQATLDLTQWRDSLQTNLPGSEAVIQQIDTAEYCVAIVWDEPGRPLDGNGNSACSLTADEVGARSSIAIEVTL